MKTGFVQLTGGSPGSLVVSIFEPFEVCGPCGCNLNWKCECSWFGGVAVVPGSGDCLAWSPILIRSGREETPKRNTKVRTIVRLASFTSIRKLYVLSSAFFPVPALTGGVPESTPVNWSRCN